MCSHVCLASASISSAALSINSDFQSHFFSPGSTPTLNQSASDLYQVRFARFFMVNIESSDITSESPNRRSNFFFASRNYPLFCLHSSEELHSFCILWGRLPVPYSNCLIKNIENDCFFSSIFLLTTTNSACRFFYSWQFQMIQCFIYSNSWNVKFCSADPYSVVFDDVRYLCCSCTQPGMLRHSSKSMILDSRSNFSIFQVDPPTPSPVPEHNEIQLSFSASVRINLFTQHC